MMAVMMREHWAALSTMMSTGSVAAREALILAAVPIAEAVARSFRIEGQEPEDLLGIARLAAVRSVETWQPSGASLNYWAALHARNALLTAKAKEERRLPTVCIDDPAPGEERLTLEETIADPRSHPTLARSAARNREIAAAALKLASLHEEGEILRAVMEDRPWAQLGRDLGLTRQAVSQRAKRLFSRLREDLIFLGLAP